MLTTLLATIVIVLSQQLPSRLVKEGQKKKAVTGLLFLAVLFIWMGTAVQSAKIRKLEKIADQVRFGELVREGKKEYQDKRIEEVRKISDKLISGKQGYGYFLRGVLDMDQSRVEDAEANFQKAIALGMPPEEAPYAWLNLGNAAIKRKDFSSARQRFNEALKINPEFEPAKINLDAIDAWEGKQIIDKYAWGQS